MIASLPHIPTEFFRLTETPAQAAIDWLVVRNGVPASALMHDADGYGFALGFARVERVDTRFDFRDDGIGAIIVVARDVGGEPADLVAWEPRDNWVAPRMGHVGMLGAHTLLHPRLGDPLPVHLGMLSWLRDGRDGCLILDHTHAWRTFEGVTIAATSVNEKLELQRILRAPLPNVVVQAQVKERAA